LSVTGPRSGAWWGLVLFLDPPIDGQHHRPSSQSASPPWRSMDSARPRQPALGPRRAECPAVALRRPLKGSNSAPCPREARRRLSALWGPRRRFLSEAPGKGLTAWPVSFARLGSLRLVNQTGRHRRSASAPVTCLTADRAARRRSACAAATSCTRIARRLDDESESHDA